MSIVVEDGSGVEGANAYVSVDACAAYCEARGLTFAASPSVTGEQAIVRATQAIDARYRGRFPGTKVGGRDQALEWPRSGGYDANDDAIPDDEVPQEIIDATCEAAVRELAEAGSMQPDLERGGDIRRMKAGSVEIEYGGGSLPTTTFTIIDGILASLLGNPLAAFTGTSVRG